MPFRIINHTADLALELTGTTEADLCVALVAGLSRLYAGPVALPANAEAEVTLAAPSAEALLVRLANEVIFRFDAHGELALALRNPQILPGDEWRFTGTLLLADARAGLEQEADLKAATYHGLEVQYGAGGLRATIVIDT